MEEQGTVKDANGSVWRCFGCGERHVGTFSACWKCGREREVGSEVSQVAVQPEITEGREPLLSECMEIAVVTQGRTLDETVKHLQEATALHLEGEHLADFGLREKPTLVLTMELDPAHAQAS